VFVKVRTGKFTRSQPHFAYGNAVLKRRLNLYLQTFQETVRSVGQLKREHFPSQTGGPLKRLVPQRFVGKDLCKRTQQSSFKFFGGHNMLLLPVYHEEKPTDPTHL
jgi:hypothetical protein